MAYIKLYLNLEDAYKGRGLAYLHLGRFGSAVPDFSATHGLSPADTETIALLGIAKFARGEDAKAIAHLEDALARTYPY
mgnify:CR=1 FL=1